MPGKERLSRCPSLEPTGPLATESIVVFDEGVEKPGWS
jgi:hypothetical protein